MASFNDLADTAQLRHRHSGMVTIFVEGPTDVDFLNRMFPKAKGDIRFEPVGGCTRMRARLDLERPDNPKVVGIVDRDALFKDKRWDDLFETDNDNFERATCIDGLYVLTRWEIENYLLDIVAVHRLFSAWARDPKPSEEVLLDKMTEAALAELHVTAGWCTAKRHRVEDYSGPGPCEDPHVLPDRVRQWIEQHVPQALADYDAHLDKVLAFDPGEGVGKRERLHALLRMVDGKRFLERLQVRWLDLKYRDPAPQLADNVGLSHPRNDDLFRFVEGLLRSA